MVMIHTTEMFTNGADFHETPPARDDYDCTVGLHP